MGWLSWKALWPGLQRHVVAERSRKRPRSATMLVGDFFYISRLFVRGPANQTAGEGGGPCMLTPLALPATLSNPVDVQQAGSTLRRGRHVTC